MAGFITNYIQNTAMGMLSTGITAAGNIAGNAVGGIGGVIENGGRTVGGSMRIPFPFLQELFPFYDPPC